MQDDLLIDLFEFLLFEPSDFAGSQNLLVDLLLERSFVREFGVAGLHVPTEGKGALQVLDALVDEVATLTILVLSELNLGLAEA